MVVMWRRLSVLGVIFVLVGVALGSTAPAQEPHVFLVSKDADSRQVHEDEWGEGTAFERIYVTLDELADGQMGAVNAAEMDPEQPLYLILVEEGTYTEQVKINAGSNIMLRGILPLFETTTRRPVVTIDGDGSGPVVKIEGTGSGVTLDTLNITGGDIGVEIIGESENKVAVPTIMSCVISGNTDGIECWENSAPRIINCMVVDNTDTGIVCHEDSEPWLMNDTVAGNSTGIDFLANVAEIEHAITNTIAWDNSVVDIDVIGLTEDLSVSFSDIDDPDLSGSNDNIWDNPLFIDTSTGNYGIPVGSPCVDVGTDEDAPLVDFEGEARFDVVGWNNDLPGPVVDIGADEYVPDGYVLSEPVAYAIPDPTSLQPPGGLLIFAFGADGGGVDVLSAAGKPIPLRIILRSGGTVIATNSGNITESTGDGTAEIWVEGDLAGTFLIDTTPPTIGPGPPNPFGILDGGEGAWLNHNDFIDASELNVAGHWEATYGLPTPYVPLGQEVPNDGEENFFFNTGATLVDGTTIAGTGEELLTIDFIVEANDVPALGADVASGFDEYSAPSGRPVIRPRTHADQFFPPIPGGAGPATTWTLQFRPAAEGVYRIDIVAEDRAGNLSDPVPLTVYWDKTPPETRITSKPRNPEPSTQASFTWRLAGSQDPNYSTVLQDWQGFWNTLLGFTPFYFSESTTYSGLTVDDRYRFTVLAIDDAGNLEAAITPYNQWEWMVSNPVPNTVITSGPPRVTTARQAVFTFKEVPEDPSVSFQWKVGDAVWTNAGARHTVATTVSRPPGTAVQYVFSVRAGKDYGGSEGPVYDPTPATYSWTVVSYAVPDDPGIPRLPLFHPDLPPAQVQQIIRDFRNSLEPYGVGGYVDAPGEQPVKYMREVPPRR